MHEVSPEHLRLLAQIAGGETEMKSGQKSLWPYYSFDTMPLELISSIYEMFVNTDTQEEADAKKKTGAKTKVDAKRKGTHYTPGYIVDAVLDGVLPWDDKRWDLRILDPACGSGIFLVKAFQRLVHRWRLAHPGREPPAALLKRILEEEPGRRRYRPARGPGCFVQSLLGNVRRDRSPALLDTGQVSQAPQHPPGAWRFLRRRHPGHSNPGRRRGAMTL